MPRASRSFVPVVVLALLAAVLAGLLLGSRWRRPDGGPRTAQERQLYDTARRSVEGVLGRPLTDAERRMIVIERKGGTMSGAHIRSPLADELRRRSDERMKELATQPATDAEPAADAEPGVANPPEADTDPSPPAEP